MTQDALHLTCPAKVNLALGVDPPDSQGMHPIASWMVAVDFGDALTLRRRDDRSTFDLSFAEDAPVPGEVDWPIEKDLAFRAHAAMEAEAGRALPVDVVLRKQTPPGRGLGGGSADAAGMLVGLRRLFSLDISDRRLRELARTLGSDVVFLTAAMLGMPAALVAGLGEQIEPLRPAAPVDLVLIFPPVDCPTGQVYRAFDEATGRGVHRVGADAARVRSLAGLTPLPADAPFNDLAAAAFAVRPSLERTHAGLESLLQMPVHVTGSGSALFIVAPGEAAAAALAHRVAELAHLPARATRTL